MRALVAMSGGVDSALTALLLKEAGYECLGVTMQLHNRKGEGESCGSRQDALDAAAVCERLGIEHKIVDLSHRFAEKVVTPFIESYERGRTPNPCIDCNRHMKFGALLELADKLGYDKVATGHYARIAENDGAYALMRGLDPKKDQSYVLWFLKSEQLSRILFPLGDFESKEQVRALAAEKGLVSAHKPDSQDICFVPDGDYAAFIRAQTGREYPAGDFVTPTGEKLGTHKGLIHYTVGQRKGLGLALPAPGYVTEKRFERNEIVVGFKEDLSCNAFSVHSLCRNAPITGGLRCTVCTRYQARPLPVTLFPGEKDTLTVFFDTPQKRPAAGQSAVFYDGDTVLGGGVIL